MKTNFILHAVKLNLFAAVIILFVLAAGWLLDKRYSNRWKYMTWLIVSVCLLIPARIPGNMGVVKIKIPQRGGFTVYRIWICRAVYRRMSRWAVVVNNRKTYELYRKTARSMGIKKVPRLLISDQEEGQQFQESGTRYEKNSIFIEWQASLEQNSAKAAPITVKSNGNGSVLMNGIDCGQQYGDAHDKLVQEGWLVNTAENPKRFLRENEDGS